MRRAAGTFGRGRRRHRRTSRCQLLPIPLTWDGPLHSQFKYDYLMMISGAVSGGVIVTTTGSAAVGMIAAMSGAAALGSIALPALALAIPAYLLLAGAGVQGVFRGQIESAKQELRAHFTQLRVSAYKHFFEVDLGAPGRYSMVDEYFGSVKRTVNEQIQGPCRAKIRKKRRTRR